jgi:hypothetical protein
MKKLSDKEWTTIFGNLKEENEEIEVTWLDEVGGPGEWVLCFDCELFEDGYKTEKEAQERLDYLENKFL